MYQLRKTQLDLIRIQGRPQAVSENAAEVKEMIDALQQDQRELQMLAAERQMATQNLRTSNQGVEAEMDEINSSRRLKWIVIEDLK